MAHYIRNEFTSELETAISEAHECGYKILFQVLLCSSGAKNELVISHLKLSGALDLSQLGFVDFLKKMAQKMSHHVILSGHVEATINTAIAEERGYQVMLVDILEIVA